MELHNQMAVRVDVSGWKFTEGIDFIFPEGSVMEPGGYRVLSSNPSHASMADVDRVFGPFTGSLNNGGVKFGRIKYFCFEDGFNAYRR